MGIIETSSGDLDAIRGEIRTMRALTDKPFGVNIALAYVRDPEGLQLAAVGRGFSSWICCGCLSLVSV